MDIIAHFLWTFILFKIAVKKYSLKLNPLVGGFFGVFPDLFAFLPFYIFMIFNKNYSGLTHSLYNISHSLVVFLAVFLILSLIFRKFVFVLFGWLLHILIDIPTHTSDFFPTPFLWPLSGFTFSGIKWGNFTFMVINYSALVLVYLYFYRDNLALKKKI